MRYLSNGTIDNSFAQSGLLTYAPASSNPNFILSYPLPILQPDNSLVVAMSGGYYSPTYAIHVLTNGAIDNSYNNSGLAVSGGGLTFSSITSGLPTLNNETLLANSLGFSSVNTYYSGEITALYNAGVLDTLSQLNNLNNNSFQNITPTELKANGSTSFFMMANGSIGYPDVEMFKYKIGVSPFIIQSFTGQKEPDSTSLLQWNVASVQNENHFEILRSVDKATWITIGNINANASTSYSYRDSFPNDTSNYYRIKMVGNGNAYTYSPNIVLLAYHLAPPDCSAPVPYVYQITDTSATLKFNSSGSNNTVYYQYAYMPADGYTYTSPPTNLPLLITTDTTAHIGRLSAAATYYVFVRAMCNTNSPTAWSFSTFKTLCDTAAVPYTELFTSSGFPCIATNAWAYNYGNNGAELSYGYSSQASGWFFTKRFYLTAGKTYRVYFQYSTSDFSTLKMVC